MNARGLAEDDLRQIMDKMLDLKYDAVCLTETWHYRKGPTTLLDHRNNEFTFICYGEHQPTGCTRQRPRQGGVGIILSPFASLHWDGMQRGFGDRIVAARLCFPNKINITIACAYAPHTGYHANIHHNYKNDLAELESCTSFHDHLFVLSDANANIGTDQRRHFPKAMGAHGSKKSNPAGIALLQTMDILGWTVANSQFKKKTKHFETHFSHLHQKWLHLDYLLTRQRDRRLIEDVSATTQWLSTDHKALRCKIRLKKLQPTSSQRFDPKPKINIALLRNDAIAARFTQAFADALRLQPDSSSNYEKLVAANKAASEILRQRTRQRPPWFITHERVMLKAIAKRDHAQQIYNDNPCTSTARARNNARQNVKRVTQKCKESEIVSITSEGNNANPDPWGMAKKLAKAFKQPTKTRIPLMKQPDGSISKTMEESADALKGHFDGVFASNTATDTDAIEELHQYDIDHSLADTPSAKEIQQHIAKMKAGKAPGSDGLTADALKIMMLNPAAKALIIGMIQIFWRTLDVPSEWLQSILRIIPKSGDLSSVKRWRPLCLLQVCSKIVGSIVAARLDKLASKNGTEKQCGFRKGVGTQDGIFNVKQVISKRRELGLDTYSFLLDLVGAFDGVEREMAWLILAKFGAPPHIIELIKALYDGSSLSLNVEGFKVLILSISGMKQGDQLASIIFKIVIQAALSTLHFPPATTPLLFRGRFDGILASRDTDHYDNIANSYWPGAEDIDNDNFLTEDHHVNHVYEFVNQLGLYADDICALFASLADLTAAVNVVNKCLLRFSLRMHYNAVGSTGKSKSVCMWFRTANVENPRELPLPPPIHINSVTIGNTTYPDGEVTFVHKQKYLGTWLTTDGNDNYDVEQRISAAAGIFATNAYILRCKHVTKKTKKLVFLACVVYTLIYGSENHCATSSNIAKMTSFYNNCVRSMLEVSKWRQWKMRATTADLNAMLGVEHLRYYIDQRALRWLGHIQRMKPERLPKRLMYSYIPGVRRPAGGQTKTFNRRMTKMLIDMATTLPPALASPMHKEQDAASDAAASAAAETARLITANNNRDNAATALERELAAAPTAEAALALAPPLPGWTAIYDKRRRTVLYSQGLRSNVRHAMMLYCDAATLQRTATAAAPPLPPAHHPNNPAWRANSTATKTAWMQCSTWTDVANDRNLWKTTVDAYLGSKTYT